MGEKTVENRSKTSTYRGLLLIHAGKANDELDELAANLEWSQFQTCFTLGAIIGAVELSDVVEFGRPLETNLYAGGPYCYLLKNPRWFCEPIPCTGQLGIFGRRRL